MKKILLPVFMLGLSATFVLSVSNSAPKKASAYEVSSLTTTIDLNDSSADEIREYYSSLSSLSENERKGTNLLKNLKTILSNGQKYYNYDSGDNVWKMYEITDRDSDTEKWKKEKLPDDTGAAGNDQCFPSAGGRGCRCGQRKMDQRVGRLVVQISGRKLCKE